MNQGGLAALPVVYNADATNKQLPSYFNDPNISERIKKYMYNQRISGNIGALEAGLISKQKPEEQKEIYRDIKKYSRYSISKTR